MESKESEKQEEQSRLPDFVEDEKKAADFGETEHPEAEQESFPELGNQSQTGAATNNSKLDIEPNEDGDDSLAKVDN